MINVTSWGVGRSNRINISPIYDLLMIIMRVMGVLKVFQWIFILKVCKESILIYQNVHSKRPVLDGLTVTPPFSMNYIKYNSSVFYFHIKTITLSNDMSTQHTIVMSCNHNDDLFSLPEERQSFPGIFMSTQTWTCLQHAKSLQNDVPHSTVMLCSFPE